MRIIPILHIIIKHKTTLYGVNNKLKIRYSIGNSNITKWSNFNIKLSVY